MALCNLSRRISKQKNQAKKKKRKICSSLTIFHSMENYVFFFVVFIPILCENQNSQIAKKNIKNFHYENNALFTVYMRWQFLNKPIYYLICIHLYSDFVWIAKSFVLFATYKTNSPNWKMCQQFKKKKKMCIRCVFFFYFRCGHLFLAFFFTFTKKQIRFLGKLFSRMICECVSVAMFFSIWLSLFNAIRIQNTNHRSSHFIQPIST